MALFFTSDTHFGHANIIALVKRPFSDVAEMDEALISCWNDTVGPGDTVYHLGDFCYRNSAEADDYLDRLNGEIHLIVGNHDGQTVERHKNRFASVQHILEIEVGDQDICLCHFPMREWNNAWTGGWHLFGHVHGRLDHEPHGFSLDVGVDTHDFRPWSIEEIAAVMSTRSNPFGGKHRRPRVAKTPRLP